MSTVKTKNPPDLKHPLETCRIPHPDADQVVCVKEFGQKPFESPPTLTRPDYPLDIKFLSILPIEGLVVLEESPSGQGFQENAATNEMGGLGWHEENTPEGRLQWDVNIEGKALISTVLRNSQIDVEII